MICDHLVSYPTLPLLWRARYYTLNANLNYNLLLRSSWTHAMHAIASSLFCVIHFPHQGKIVTVDQLSFFASSSSYGNILYVKYTGAPYEGVGARIFKDPALMGLFLLPPPHVFFFNMILVKSDPQVIPSPDLVATLGEVMLLSPTEINYVEIVSASSSVSSNIPMSRTSLNVSSHSPWLSSSLMVMSMCLENLSSLLPIDMSVSPDIVKICQLKAPLSLHGFRFFIPPRVFTDYPLLQWGCHLLTYNTPSPRGHGDITLYEFYSIIWPSRCLIIMSMIRLPSSSVLINYSSFSMDSLKKYYA